MRAMLPEARRAVTSLAIVLVGTTAFAVPLVAAPPAAAPRVVSSLQPLPAQAPDVPWPTKEWPTGPLPATVSAAALEPFLAVTAARQPRRLGETRAVVIIHHGRLVAERYMPGFTADTRLLSWSMAKSVTQALAGIAVRRGLVDIDKPMGDPRWAPGDPRAAIPWRWWLNMVDGQDYNEIGVVDQTRNDAARMLYGVGRRDVSGFGVGLPLIHTPGTYWNYNSAGVNLIAAALGRLFAPGVTSPVERRARIAAVLRDELFAPIGMTSAQPEFDATGNFVGSALVYATARDWARFGLLYLRDGVWDGKRILPEGWVDFARTKNPAANSDVYGAGFWLTPATGNGKPYTSVGAGSTARDLFIAQGHEGQLVIIVPSKDLVVVRLGRLNDLVGWDALGEWVGGVVNLF
jgi:CubicO group peptidase (beta-lactamase class C family)